MMKLLDEFRRGWQGIAQPSPLFNLGFSTFCVAVATAARWALAAIRPDLFFGPYLPAVFFASAVGGARFGIFTAVLGGALGCFIDFGGPAPDSTRIVLLLIFWAIAGPIIWGVEHYRSILAQQQ